MTPIVSVEGGLLDLGAAALRLASRGFAVFPPRQGPRTLQRRQVFQEPSAAIKCASRDPALIEFWWSRHPQANIGLADSAARVGQFRVLDLDGDEDEAWLREHEIEHGETIAATVEVITGKGGTSISAIRTASTSATPRIAATCRTCAVTAATPCCRQIHLSGCAYAWSVDSADELRRRPRVADRDRHQ